MIEKPIICVDTNDNIIGTCTKSQAHQNPILHRAFSVFVTYGDKMLLQQRAKQKYHCGGLWTNACCSHPFCDDIIHCAHLRMEQELLITPQNIKHMFDFVYFYKFENGLFEYEYDHVFLAHFSPVKKIYFNTDEVSQIKWVNFKSVKNMMQKYPQKFTPWFLHACPRVLDMLSK